jgi:hypothetical protein
MMRRKTSLLSGILFIALASMAQQLSEAPAGFDTPTLVDNPGSQSISNGLPEPVLRGKSFRPGTAIP